MIRNNNSKSTYSSFNSTKLPHRNSNDDNFLNLPDLSGLNEDEKQHILSVLIRDENLRSKHLARFTQLKKEVAELEQKPKSASPSVCAQCLTPFGLIFNTGDTCPKCGAKVCQQCRRMHNVNDNGWICQLCCKRKQLLSYSGDWMYSNENNPRKNSVTASEVIRKSLSPQETFQGTNGIQSSDSDSDIVPYKSSPQRFRFDQPISNTNNINPMVLQTPTDEQKLNSIKQSAQTRPYQVITSSLNRKSPSASNQAGASSDDVDSLHSSVFSDRTASPHSSQRNLTDKSQERSASVQKSAESISTLQNSTNNIDNNGFDKHDDCDSVTPSEWSLDSDKNEPSTLERHNASKKRSVKESLSSHMHLHGSIPSLRNVKDRFSKSNTSASQLSLNTEGKSKSEIVDQQNKSNSRLNLEKESSTTRHKASASTLTLEEPKKPQAFTSVGNLNVIDDTDDDEDIDREVEKAKMAIQKKRASSFIDLRGSQVSLNSALSDTKARYGLDISGTIELKLTHAEKTGALDVYVNKCTNLAKAKRHGSDVFVKLYLLPDLSKPSKRKTQVKKNTVDPIFEDRFRYYVTKQDVTTRIIWVTVWSQTSVGHNDFLGEIHIPLANCKWNDTHEYALLARKHKKDLSPTIQPTMDPGEIQFQLTFLQNPKVEHIGTVQVSHIEGKNIYHGRAQVEAVCKGLLMPDNVICKLPTVSKGPTPRWQTPLRWEGVLYDNLKNISVEVSIWNRERFKKTNLGFVRLNLAHGHFDTQTVTWLDATTAEKSAWEEFLREPSKSHVIKLPLRPAFAEK